MTGRGSPVASQVVTGLSQPFQVGYGGSLFQLDQNGNLWRYSSAAGWSVIHSGVTSFALEPNGSDYMVYLDSSGNLFQNFQDYSGESLLATSVKSYAFDYNGQYLIYLTSTGTLYRETKNQATPIHTGVVSFALEPNGSDYMVYLDSSGNLFQNFQAHSGESLLVTSVKSYAFDHNGQYLIYLTSTGTLYRETKNQATPIHTGVVSFALDPNGSDYMVYLDSSGNLFQNFQDASGESLIATGIASYSFDYNGQYLIYLTSTGTLYRETKNQATPIHMGVVSFALDPNGSDYMVYLDSSGNLFQNFQDASGESLIATGIASYSFDYNGQYLIYLTSTGTLYRETNNQATPIHTGVVSFALDPNGSDYMVYLDSSGNLFQNFQDASGESLIATGIASYSFDYNGQYLIYLTSTGTLYRETNNQATPIHTGVVSVRPGPERQRLYGLPRLERQPVPELPGLQR